MQVPKPGPFSWWRLSPAAVVLTVVNQYGLVGDVTPLQSIETEHGPVALAYNQPGFGGECLSIDGLKACRHAPLPFAEEDVEIRTPDGTLLATRQGDELLLEPDALTARAKQAQRWSFTSIVNRLRGIEDTTTNRPLELPNRVVFWSLSNDGTEVRMTLREDGTLHQEVWHNGREAPHLIRRVVWIPANRCGDACKQAPTNERGEVQYVCDPEGRCTAVVCFAEGTPVQTPSGRQPIETLQPGDLVLAKDPETGRTEWKAVARTFETPNRPLRRLVLRRELSGTVWFDELEATAEHPFYVPDVGWRPVSALEVGVRVATQNGHATVVENIALGGKHTVFNLEVEDFHTYFVGELDAWVHNQCGPDDPNEITESEATAPGVHVEIRRRRVEHQIVSLQIAESAERRAVVDTVAQALADAGVAENDMVVVSSDAVPRETLRRLRFGSVNTLVGRALQILQLQSSPGEPTADGLSAQNVGTHVEPKVVPIRPWSVNTPEFRANPAAFLTMFRSLDDYSRRRFEEFFAQHEAGEPVVSWGELGRIAFYSRALSWSMKRHGLGQVGFDGPWMALRPIDLNQTTSFFPVYLTQSAVTALVRAQREYKERRGQVLDHIDRLPVDALPADVRAVIDLTNGPYLGENLERWDPPDHTWDLNTANGVVLGRLGVRLSQARLIARRLRLGQRIESWDELREIGVEEHAIAFLRERLHARLEGPAFPLPQVPGATMTVDDLTGFGVHAAEEVIEARDEFLREVGVPGTLEDLEGAGLELSPLDRELVLNHVDWSAPEDTDDAPGVDAAAATQPLGDGSTVEGITLPGVDGDHYLRRFTDSRAAELAAGASYMANGALLSETTYGELIARPDVDDRNVAGTDLLGDYAVPPNSVDFAELDAAQQGEARGHLTTIETTLNASGMWDLYRNNPEIEVTAELDPVRAPAGMKFDRDSGVPTRIPFLIQARVRSRQRATTDLRMEIPHDGTGVAYRYTGPGRVYEDRRLAGPAEVAAMVRATEVLASAQTLGLRGRVPPAGDGGEDLLGADPHVTVTELELLNDVVRADLLQEGQAIEAKEASKRLAMQEALTAFRQAPDFRVDEKDRIHYGGVILKLWADDRFIRTTREDAPSGAGVMRRWHQPLLVVRPTGAPEPLQDNVVTFGDSPTAEVAAIGDTEADRSTRDGRAGRWVGDYYIRSLGPGIENADEETRLHATSVFEDVTNQLSVQPVGFNPVLAVFVPTNRSGVVRTRRSWPRDQRIPFHSLQGPARARAIQEIRDFTAQMRGRVRQQGTLPHGFSFETVPLWLPRISGAYDRYFFHENGVMSFADPFVFERTHGGDVRTLGEPAPLTSEGEATLTVQHTTIRRHGDHLYHYVPTDDRSGYDPALLVIAHDDMVRTFDPELERLVQTPELVAIQLAADIRRDRMVMRTDHRGQENWYLEHQLPSAEARAAAREHKKRLRPLAIEAVGANADGILIFADPGEGGDADEPPSGETVLEITDTIWFDEHGEPKAWIPVAVR